ncbi:carbohydrate ABC transporter permease [Candidatus Hydrogenedentota bacterium]
MKKTDRSSIFWRNQQKLAPYIFIAPFFIVFALFMVYPLFNSFATSLYHVRGLQARIFCGLSNYGSLMTDITFWRAVFNTTVFALGSLLIQLPLALLLAVALNSKFVRCRNLFRLAFFMPMLISGVFVGMIFTLFYDGRYGMLNMLLRTVGFTADIEWVQNPATGKLALVMAGVWQFAGLNMVYFLAGLQGVRQELYEAADIDGANRVQSFFHVTLPSIKPIAAFVVIMSMIGSFQIFELPYILVPAGGEKQHMLTIVMLLQRSGFTFMKMGYACAIGWVLAGIIFAISLVQTRLFGVFKE